MSSIAERIMSPWRVAMAFIDSTAEVPSVVIAAKFLRLVSTIDSTLIIGNLNSPAILLKSKLANGFWKAPLAYMGKLLRKGWGTTGSGNAETQNSDRKCCGAQRCLIYVLRLRSQGAFVRCTKILRISTFRAFFPRNRIFLKELSPALRSLQTAVQGRHGLGEVSRIVLIECTGNSIVERQQPVLAECARQSVARQAGRLECRGHRAAQRRTEGERQHRIARACAADRAQRVAMWTQRIVAAHHRVEQSIARRLLRIAVLGHAGQHLGVDARHEGRRQRHLVRIERIELGEAEACRLGHLAQSHLDEALLADQPQERVERRLPVTGLVAHPASSLERREAAASALSNTGWMPSPAIRTFKASAVVPPGLVTLTRSCDAGSDDCRSNSPLPDTVARASCMAISGERPSLAP